MIITIILVIILLVVFQIILWKNRPLKNKKDYRVVKAGNVLKPSALTIAVAGLKNKQFEFGGENISTEDYDIFIVDGESMSKNDIHTGDAVFVKRLLSTDKYNIQKYPVILLEIDNSISSGRNDEEQDFTEYKLRKFISYFDSENSFESWFANVEKLSLEIADNKQAINEKYNKCIECYSYLLSGQRYTLVFSSTLDADTNKTSYSFHPIIFLYGVVEFILPKSKFSY